MKLPKYFILSKRPVKFIETPSGGMEVFAFDWDTGKFERDMSYLPKIFDTVDVEELTEMEFLKVVDHLKKIHI